jgi:hypothetical protein
MVGGLCILQMATVVHFYMGTRVWDRADGVSGVVQVLRRCAGPDEPVLFSSPFTFVPALYYGKRPSHWLFCPSDAARVPAFYGTSALTPDMMCDEESRHDIATRFSAVWLVEQDDGKLRLPFHWRRSGTIVVPDDYATQRRLLVSRCEIDPAYLAE